MQKPSPDRVKRSYSSSPYREKNKEREFNTAKVQRKIKIDTINKMTGLNLTPNDKFVR